MKKKTEHAVDDVVLDVDFPQGYAAFDAGPLHLTHGKGLCVLNTGGPREPPSPPAPPPLRFTWRKSTMIESLVHATARTLVGPIENYTTPEGDDGHGLAALFTDGTAIYCTSDFVSYESGSFPREPEFWIGEPR